MVSISRAAPAASRIWSVALIISGPIPSPCATVIGVLVGISGIPKIIGLLHIAQPSRTIQRRSVGGLACVLAGGHRCGGLILGHDDPGHEVRNEADPGAKCQGQPDHPDENHVYRHVACKAGADTCDLPVPDIAGERALLGLAWSGKFGGVRTLRAEAVLFAQLNAALGTKHSSLQQPVTHAAPGMFPQSFGGLQDRGVAVTTGSQATGKFTDCASAQR